MINGFDYLSYYSKVLATHLTRTSQANLRLIHVPQANPLWPSASGNHRSVYSLAIVSKILPKLKEKNAQRVQKLFKVME